MSDTIKHGGNKGFRCRGAPAILSVCLVLAGCGGHGAPKGQVVAVVAGQEVTFQDLAAQARIDGVARADPKALLQKVIGRVLLAQEAHRKGLDRYPGYPSDMAALQQNFLAQKEARANLKPTAPPNAAQVAAFAAAHPALFARREKVGLNEIVIHDGLDRKSLQDPGDMNQLERRLNALNASFDRRQLQVDTAEMPPALAMRVLEAPDGALTFIESPRETLAFTVTSRAPVTLSQDAEQALASRLIMQQSEQQQVDRLLQAQESHAKIAYQKGYAPDEGGSQAAPHPVRPPGNAT